MVAEPMRSELARLHRLEARDARLRGDPTEALRLSAIGLAVERGAYAHNANLPAPPPPVKWGPPPPLPPPPATPAPCGPCGPKK